MPAVVPQRGENAMSKPSFGSSSGAFGSLLLKQSRVRGRWDSSRSVTEWSPPKYPLDMPCSPCRRQQAQVEDNRYSSDDATGIVTGWSAHEYRPSVGSGGVRMEALQGAFVEATGFNLDPEQYGFSVPAFVLRHIGRTLPAKWQQLEPSGQFVITLAEPEGPGTVAPPREAGAVAPHPSVWEEADLLVSLPQPRSQPKCFPQGLFGPCSAAQQPAVGSPEAHSLRVFSPESVEPCAPRQSPPAYAPCPPERPLVPPVELEGPFQMRDGLSTECSPVFVSHIYSAHHFYVQHMDGDTARTLEWLMRDLEAACTGWYQSLITAEDLSAGMPCVAPYTYGHGRTVWLRGVVYGFDAEDDRYAPVSDDPVDAEAEGRLTNKELKAIVSRLQAFLEEQGPSQEEELPHVLGSRTLAAAVVA